MVTGMGILRDKQAKRLLCALSALCLLMICAGIALCFWIGARSRSMMLDRDRAITASLLEQGVSPATAAAALKNTEAGPQGAEFLIRIGVTEETPLIFFPAISRLLNESLLLVLAGALVFSLILTCSVLLFLLRRDRLYRQAQDTAMRFYEGDFSCRFPIAESGSLYQFFSAVNQLATALQAKSENELAGREFLKDTISDISHQLKTPLAALNMYQEIISGEPDNPEMVKRFSGKMGQALERMGQLISSLLKITRMDAGSIQFEKEKYSMGELAGQATELFIPRAQAEGKELIVNGKPEEVLCCDPQWTSEAIGNLLKNALDHTGPGGHIRLSWEKTPAMLHILIEDDGCGIAADDLPHIFKRFYRSKHTQDTPGIGLGLPLAKTIIESQGGVLSVQSRPGQGTLFTISFLTDS